MGTWETKIVRMGETISFNYLEKGLEMSVYEAETVKHLELRNLQNQRKLCLILVLDHTLLHTNLNINQTLCLN